MRRKIISFRNLQGEIELVFLQNNKKPQPDKIPDCGHIYTKNQLKTIQKIEHNLACMDYAMIFCL